MNSALTKRTGSTLIEVALSCLILMILAVAGGAFVANSHRTLSLHRSRSIAAAIAASRLEELRATSYATLTNLTTVAGGSVAVTRSGSSWVTGNYQPYSLGTRTEQLRTTLRLTNVVVGSGQYEALLMTAIASYQRAGAVTDTVSVATIYSP